MTYPSDYKPGQVLTAVDLNASFDGKTENANAAITGGSAEGLDHVYVMGATDSINPQTGALVVTGGVGVGLQLQVGGKLTVGASAQIKSAAVSNDAATGALTVAGGVGVGGAINSGGHIKAIGNLIGAAIVGTDTTNAVDPVTGALTTAGGAGIAKNLHVGGGVAVVGGLSVQGNAVVAGSASVGSLIIAQGGGITFGDGSTQITAIPEAPNDGNKYGRKSLAWAVLTDIPEAPQDGKKYGRVNATWATLLDTPDAPNDAFYYGRHANAWAKVTAEAPVDAFAYARANAAWAKSVLEAPSDDQQYSRRNGAWQVLSASGMWRGDTPPVDVARYPQWYNTNTSTLYVWYDDGDSAQWVICVPVPGTDEMTGAIWGQITGDITAQQDLVDYVAAHSGGGGGSGLPVDGSGAMTGPIVAIPGTSAATALNFGVANTGIYSSSGSINFSVLGNNRYLFGSTFTCNAPIRAADGTVAAPAYSFLAENGTGFYRKAAKNIRISAGGADVVDINANQATSYLSVYPTAAAGIAQFTLQDQPLSAVDYHQLYTQNSSALGYYLFAEGLGGAAVAKKMVFSFAAGCDFGGGGPIVVPQVLTRNSTSAEIDLHPSGNTSAWPDTGGALLAVRGSTFESYGAGAISIYTGSAASGVAMAGGSSAWAALSDDRLKTLDTDIVDGLAAVLAIRPIRFKYLTDAPDFPMRVGLSAQSVQAHIPEAISEVPLLEGPDKTPSSELYLSLRYTEVIPHLVSAIKTLSSNLTTSQTKVATLEHKLQAINDALDSM